MASSSRKNVNGKRTVLCGKQWEPGPGDQSQAIVYRI